MNNRDNLSTRDRIVAEAERLLHVEGYRAMSVADIVDAAGVEKGTLYHYFSGKQDLALCVIEKAGVEHLAFVKDSLEGDTPRDQLDSFIDAASRMKQDESFVGGCLFGNIALEASDTHPELATAVREIFNRWAAIMKPVIRAGQDQDQIRDDFAPETIAHHVIAVLEGSIMQGRLRKDATIFKGNIECLKRFLGS